MSVLRDLAAELEETSPRTSFRLLVVLHDVTAYLAAELEETSPRTGFRLVVVLHDVTAYDQAFLWAGHSPDFERGLADRRYRRKPYIEIHRGVPS